MAPRKDYTPKQMGDAITAVKRGEPVATAAKRYGVPRITLFNKISGKSPMQCSMGPSTVLTHKEEDLLVKWLLAAAKRRFPVSKDQLLDSVQRIVTEQKRSTPFTGNRPGKKWFASFLKRHPIVAQRTAENLSSARDDVTEEQIINWFREVELYITAIDMRQALEDPNRVFNTDESAFFLAPKPGKVLVKRGEKHVYAASGDEKENVTVLVTANAAGKLAPPMLVYAYERIPANIASSVPEDWAIGKSESGWMCSDTFFEYITTVFNPWLIKENIQKPVLFFLDGHRSHLTLHLSHFCAENGIEIIALYPNSTHILQPMDIAVFRPLKVFFRKEVVQWRLENNGIKLKKENFAPVFEKALDKISEDCIKNGFRGGGLHPFGPEYIDITKLRSLNTKEPNDQQIQETNKSFRFLELQITKIFGQDKLEMFKSLYYEGRNVLENMSLDEDLNLYITWAQIKQMVTTPTNEATSSTTLTTSCNQDQNREQGSDMSQNDYLTLNTNVAKSSAASILSMNSQEHSTHHAEAPNVTAESYAGQTDKAMSSSASNFLTKAQESTQSVKQNLILSTECVDQTKSVVTEETSQDPKDPTISPTSSRNTFEISKTNTREMQPDRSGCTPEKNSLSKALGVTVPSPFKNCLFWPDNVHKKKTSSRNKEKVPSAVTSKAWQQYYEKKDAEKKKLMEEKETRAKIRLEKKELREKQAKEKKHKMKAKKQKASEISSSEDTDMEINYVESGESEINEHSDSTWCEEEIQDQLQENKHSRQRKRKQAMIENRYSELEIPAKILTTSSHKGTLNKDLNIGCFVIIKYEGEYFPGKIENIDRGQFEISTMVLSTGNTFRWPERPDKIWYKISDIIQGISPPVKHNNRGYFKISEMEQFLPDIYMT